MLQDARANNKCPIIMEFGNGSFRSLATWRPVATSDCINQDETAIISGVWEFNERTYRYDYHASLLGGISLMMKVCIHLNTQILLLVLWLRPRN